MQPIPTAVTKDRNLYLDDILSEMCNTNATTSPLPDLSPQPLTSPPQTPDPSLASLPIPPESHDLTVIPPHPSPVSQPIP